MASPLQELMGRFYLSTSDATLNVINSAGAVRTISVASTYYYFAGYTGEAAGQLTNMLCADVQNAIRAGGGDQGNLNITYDAATGLASFAANSACNISFSYALQNIFGVASNPLRLGTTNVSTRQPRYSWRPSRSMSDYPTTSDAVVAPRSTTLTGRSKDGTTFSVGGNLLYDARLKWSHLTNSEVLTPHNGTSFADLQQWWTDVVHAGQPFRVIADRATYATNKAFAECLVGDPGGEEPREVGSFTDLVGRRVKSWNGLWDVDLEVVKEVG